MFDFLWPHGCSTPGFPVLHYLLQFAQTHVHWVSGAIQPLTHPLLPLSSPALNLSQHWGSLPMSWCFASGDQRIGASASASVLPMNLRDWFPLGWTGWISLQSKGLSRVFSNTTVQIQGLEQHKFTFSQCWRLEVQDEGASMVGFWWELSYSLADGYFLSMLSHRMTSLMAQW